MQIDDFRGKIQSILASPISSQLYLAVKNGEDLYELKLADLEDKSTEPTIRKLFCDSLHKFAVNQDLSLCDLSAADERRNALFRYDYKDYPEELKLLKEFNIAEAVKHTPKFDFTSDDLAKIKGYIIYLGTMGNGIVIYKQHYSISLIKRETFLLGAVKSKNRFEQISGNDMIRMNSDVQIIKIDDEMYVVDLDVLEKNLGFTKLIQKAANDLIDEIETLGIVEDVQPLKDSAGNIPFARKLARAKAASPLIKLQIPKEEIVQFTKTAPGLKGKFKYTEDGATIRLDTNASKEIFIKLLNDAYLYSKLTEQYYEARSKDSIANEANLV